MPKPTIVLVHGSWADGASWNAADELVCVDTPRDFFAIG